MDLKTGIVTSYAAWDCIKSAIQPCIEFPGPESVPCIDCSLESEENAVLASEIKEKAKNERVILHDLATERFRPIISIAPVEDSMISLFLVPTSFLSVWRSHVNRPTKENRPQAIDTNVSTIR